MKIKIRIPLKSEIVHSGIEGSVARTRGESWSKEQLEDYADKKGVYIHHSNRRILYVGNTIKGLWGKFGERLRREFQFTSSQNSDLHQLLASQTNPIYCYFFDLDDVDAMIETGSFSLDSERKALILEQALIGVFDPEGNKE